MIKRLIIYAIPYWAIRVSYLSWRLIRRISFAIVHAKGKKSNVTVYDLWAANKVTHEFDEDIAPVSLCYAPDAKSLVISGNNKELFFFDTRQYELQYKMEIPFVAENIAISNNNFFIAASNGTTLNIWNLQSKELRKSISTDEKTIVLLFPVTTIYWQYSQLTVNWRLTTPVHSSFCKATMRWELHAIAISIRKANI